MLPGRAEAELSFGRCEDDGRAIVVLVLLLVLLLPLGSLPHRPPSLAPSNCGRAAQTLHAALGAYEKGVGIAAGLCKVCTRDRHDT